MNPEEPKFLSLSVSHRWLASLCLALAGQAVVLYAKVEALSTDIQHMQHQIDRFEDKLDRK